MPTRKKVLHPRSNRALTNNVNKPQLPEPSFLDYGELAINYGEGIETLSIKNSENDIVTFSSDIHNSNLFTTKEETIANELVTATALTEHEGRLDDLDETVAGKQDALTFDSTPTANSTNPVTSGGIKTALDGKLDVIDFVSTFPHLTQELMNGTRVTLSSDALSEFNSLENFKDCVFKLTIPNAIDSLMVLSDYMYVDVEITGENIDYTTFTILGDALIPEYRDTTNNFYPQIKSLVIKHYYEIDQQWQYTDLGEYQLTMEFINLQPLLSSGDNIKTVNNVSLLGSGNISVQTPLTFDTTPTANSTNPVTSGGIKTYLDNIQTLQDMPTPIYRGADQAAMNVACEELFEGVKSGKILYKYNNYIAVYQSYVENSGKSMTLQFSGGTLGYIGLQNIRFTIFCYYDSDTSNWVTEYDIDNSAIVTEPIVFPIYECNTSGASSVVTILANSWLDNAIHSPGTDCNRIILHFNNDVSSLATASLTTVSNTVYTGPIYVMYNGQYTQLNAGMIPVGSYVLFAIDNVNNSTHTLELHSIGEDYYVNSGDKVKQITTATTDTELPLLLAGANPSLYPAGAEEEIQTTYAKLEPRLKVNTSTATLYANIFNGTSFTGTAARATADANGDNIVTTYAKKTDLTSLLTYKGTIGTSGTVSTLPANAAVGDTYQAIAGCPDVNNKEVEEGDLVICIGANTWTVVQNNIVVDDELDETSSNPVQNSAITQVILENEVTTAAALSNLNDNIGLNSDGEYTPTGTNYIYGSSSLAESADLLDAAVGALAAQVSDGALWEIGTGTNSLIPKNSGNTASAAKSVAIGNSTQATNSGELATGSYNSSTTANNGTETLFSVGNGTSSTRHNAFEVKGNGDIKITLNEEDVILQEYLIDNEEVISSALNDLDTRVLANEYDITQLQTSKQNAFIVGSGLTLSGNSLYANTATATTLGVVKGGGNITIAADGTLNTTVTVEVDDELDDTSTNPVENRVITNTIRDNETVTAAALTKIKESTGLDNSGNYTPSGTNYIEDAATLTEAIDLLDDAIGDISDSISDEKVAQTRIDATDSSTNISYPVLLANNDNPNGASAGANYSGITYNPRDNSGTLTLKRNQTSSSQEVIGDQLKLGTSTITFVAGMAGATDGTLTRTQYSGTAAKATADGSGNNIVNTYATKTELEDANPIILIDYWTNDPNIAPDTTGLADGFFWYNQYDNTLSVCENDNWVSVTPVMRKLYINIPANEIWRYNGTTMIRMTINPASLVTT